MGSSYLPPPEQNVVNVGEELSQTALDAINAATFPSGSNPFRTTNDGSVISDYDNFKIYSAGELVILVDRLYRFKTFIGAAGYGPITHPDAWLNVSGDQGIQGPQGAQGDPGPQGQTGDPGPQGQTGNSTIVWRGDWQSGVGYSTGDIVAYGGTSWGAKESTMGHSPYSGSYYWQMVAEKGQDGAGGAMGPTGPMGPSGQAISDFDYGTSYAEKSVVWDPSSSTPYIPYVAASYVSMYGSNPSNDSNSWKRIGEGTYLEISSFNASMASYMPVYGGTFQGRIQTPSRNSSGNAGFNLGGLNDNQGNPTNLYMGDLFLTDVEALSNAWNTRLNYVGKTYSGTLAALQVAVCNGVPNFFSQPQVISVTSSTVTQAALRINQSGTAPALVVEDFTTPDTSSLVVNADGNVGIGVAAGYTATQKLEVVGNVKADGFVNGTGPVFKVNGTQTHGGGSDTHELLVSVNGSTYRIGMRFVSTP